MRRVGGGLLACLQYAMPWGDWQFWVVTAITAACVLPLYRVLRPAKRAGHPRRTRASLTVSARRTR